MKTKSLIMFGSSNVDLNLDPIRPDWIIEGTPVASTHILSTSADGTAFTVIWECSAGRFNWHYTIDETVYVIKGSVTLRDPTGHSQRVVEGDTVFFPAGSSAEWTVDDYIRKVAFLRHPLPPPLALARRSLKRLLHRLRGRAKASGSPISIGSG
jgi:uncharacterized cupin superfamily protein